MKSFCETVFHARHMFDVAGTAGLYLYLRAGGVPTRHTHKWDGLHTRHLLESTHTNTSLLPSFPLQR